MPYRLPRLIVDTRGAPRLSVTYLHYYYFMPARKYRHPPHATICYLLPPSRKMRHIVTTLILPRGYRLI